MSNLVQTVSESLPPKWKIVPLGEILSEVELRYKGLSRREELPVLSLTRSLGLVLQSERFDRRVATEDVSLYKVVDKGQIVYNPYVIWEGAVYALRKYERGLVSPAYVVWQCNPDKASGFLVDVFLRTPLVIEQYNLFSAGAVNRRRAIKKDDFLKIRIPLPPLEEQRRIAYVLSTVQTAIEQQEKLTALTRELKSALMHKLFTEGLRGEKQKQTEIGLVPESWDVLPLGEVMEKTPQNGIYKPLACYGTGTAILRINDFGNDGDVVTTAPNRIAADESEVAVYGLKEGDIVTNRVNSLSHLGKTALVGRPAEPMLFESNMMRYRTYPARAMPSFTMRVLNSPIGKRQIVASAKRAVAQSSVNQGSLSAVMLPIPPVEEQQEIVDIIDTLVGKLDLSGRRRQSLQELFRTLLHQLMTGQVRVDHIDLPELS